MGALTGSRRPSVAGASDFDDLRRVSILTVARDLGLSLRNGACRCPLPGHEDRTPSFYVKAATNTWRCFGCGIHGSVIDLVMRVCEWDFRRTAAWMRERYLTGSLPAVAVRHPAPNRSDTALSFVPDPDIYEWVLEHCPLGREAIAYFAGRAISEGTLRAFRAGQAANPAVLAKKAVERFGYMRVKAAGLLSRRSTPSRPVCVFSQASVVFPFLRGGRCEYLQARSVGGGRLRWINLLGIRPPFFNADVLDDPAATEVVLCEGISDTLSAAELGRKAVGLLGAGSPLADSDAHLLRRKIVYVVADRDAAGGKMGERLHGQLVRAGAHPVIQRLPEGCCDLNEYLVGLRGCG